MALIKCKECGHEVSDKADKCPNCGDLKRYKPKGWGAPAVTVKKCKECNHEVSDKAVNCPNCGAPQKQRGHRWGNLIAFVLIGLLFISYFFNENKKTLYQDKSQPSTHVWNAKDADIEDVERAREFLSKLPRGCGDSKATASSDGTVTIQIECSNGNQSTSGVVKIKDGIVKDIR